MMRLLHNPAAQTIVVEHRDRLMRFGFEYVEAAMAAHGRRIVVIDPEEMTDDIVRDLHEIIVSMCARLYGKRSAKNRAQKALAAMQTADVGGDE
jgi:predicted site-specific integrase-resolvase